MSVDIKNFTPREIVSELDRFIIGQGEAKRAVAIALRNRWRRQQVSDDLRDEIAPKNIIMMGPTGVGKTEIARRLAKLASAPFIKVEASKFTEVGYVGKDVESMIRDLTDIAINMVRAELEDGVRVRADELAEERLLGLLIPTKPKKTPGSRSTENDRDALLRGPFEVDDEVGAADSSGDSTAETREKMRKMLRSGKLDRRLIDLETAPVKNVGFPMIEVVSTTGSIDEMGKNIRDMMSNMFPRGKKRKKVPVHEAMEILREEEAQKLIDMDEVVKLAIERVEQSGIVFIDEVDKIASRESGAHGPEISREGVQRDILPIVEGSRVNTKYGTVSTDHILFIAAGAFHVTKPSDLIPELQGRFPIRVELKSLKKEDFIRILTEPQNSLSKQYCALMQTERVNLQFSEDGLESVAHYAALINEQMENIGARRLHTIMEKVLDEISFAAPERSGESFKVDAQYVEKCLKDVVKDQDLSRYIL